MITTCDIKAQLPVFTLGSTEPNPKEVILIVGSCRCVPYLNYIARFSEMNDHPFRIHFIEPWDNHWNAAGEMVDFEAALLALEQDERVLSVLKETTIYIHEHYECAGMFNSSRQSPKNIYQFGMAPRVECSIPNFHDHFVLCTEQAQFDQRTRENIRSNGGVPSRQTLSEMKDYGMLSLERFYGACAKSDFPEFAEYFKDNWRRMRLFWMGNHVSRFFTLEMFQMMNDKFLHFPLNEAFWGGASQEDLFENPHVPMTQYDVSMYGLSWPEEVVPFKLP